MLEDHKSLVIWACKASEVAPRVAADNLKRKRNNKVV